MSNFKKAWIYLENGMFFEARSFGANNTAVGEIVFNTSLTGYQEIITDPSYAGQFICFSMPEIGIVGTNPQDVESSNIFAKGILIRHYNEKYSNFRANKSLGEFLNFHNAMGIFGIDTRLLTKTLRKEGAMMMIASTEYSTKEDLQEILKQSPRIEEIDYIKVVSTQEPYHHKEGRFSFKTMNYTLPQTDKKILAIDFGIKKSILRELVAAGFSVEVIPHNFKAEEIIKRYQSKEFDGIFLSNGPGDPKVLKNQIIEIQKLIANNIPIFAICLGHQLLALAQGYETYKLKFGHHGGNHPIQNLQTKKIEITAQNHIYSVPEDIAKIATITHRNLFDGTIEGLLYKNAPICSFQHHPEAGPGPLESSALFNEFSKLLQKT
ncbi:glutamine-hydrolyzing carbamoyl-phosphate synthase small subunit [Helicobacter mesocricetorum]|uniref:glutamine-hydrolyzing carbamoyl-phosphate synthase small subunit n=1 Tax=Helicobacter mesocricetorum TaxID=87012 RepID=UPI000CF0B7F4|nr:glutamine-hydrolyzing carbamoyl-phosphate synthase small subunit [Helicobacter mesocricetorum]